MQDFRSGKSTSCGCKRNKSNHKRMFEDLTGNVYNHLTVIKRVEDYKTTDGGKRVQWLCRCECGNYVVVLAYALKSGNTKSCGCYKSDMIHKRCFKDLTGCIYGHLYVIEIDHKEGKRTFYKCLCDCGTTCVIAADHLRTGHTISCGHICSVMEDVVNQYLLKNKYEYKYHQMFSDLYYNNYLEFDFALLNNNNIVALIECQGRQHYDDVGSFGKIQREITDSIKKEYCKNNNIPLYEIKYNDNIVDKLKEILNELHVNPVPSFI